MRTFKFRLRPLTPFATPLVGDTLFGHLCWSVREARGEKRLADLLQGYIAGHPFLAVSDGFPAGLLPRPTAPDFVLGTATEPRLRKLARTHRWLPADELNQSLKLLVPLLTESKATEPALVTQNTINRYTGTTGTGPFAPRQVERIFYSDDARLDLYAVFDDARIAAEELQALIGHIGLCGYGRDATTGLGKFVIEAVTDHAWPHRDRAQRYWLTLAACAPQAEVLSADGCYYLPQTRFGRHGGVAAVLDAPFKQPVMMIATGALLKARDPVHWLIHGRGLGGKDAPLSKTIPETVHQGYAPVVPLQLEDA
jgi:CRISPR-associated protein Csm4